MLTNNESDTDSSDDETATTTPVVSMDVDEKDGDDDDGKKTDSRDERKKRNKQRDMLTKIFVCAPASLMLIREEHIALRMYARPIADHFDDGSAFASKRNDHTAKVYYDPRYDMCTEYANPDWSAGLDMSRPTPSIEAFAPTFRKINATVNARQMHMAFRRERRYARNGIVSMEASGTRVRPRGVMTTTALLLRAFHFNRKMQPTFRTLVYSSVMDRYRRWLFAPLTPHSDLCDIDFDSATEVIENVLAERDNYMSNRGATLVVPACAAISTADSEMARCYAAHVEKVVSSTKSRMREKRDAVVDADDKSAKKKREIEASNTATLLADTCTMFREDVISLADRSPEFANDERLTIYIENDPMYVVLRGELRPIDTTSLCINNSDAVRLLGDGSHPAFEKERESEERSVPMLLRRSRPGMNAAMYETRYNRDEIQSRCYGSEDYYRSRDFSIGAASILSWAVRGWFPRLISDTVATLIVHDLIVATLEPVGSTHVSWASLMSPPKEKGYCQHKHGWNDASKTQCRFGVMMRYNMSGVRAPSGLLHQSMFVLPGGEMTHMPRPFVVGKGAPECASTVYVKTANEVHMYSSDPHRVFIGKGMKTRRLTQLEYQAMYRDCMSVKRY